MPPPFDGRLQFLLHEYLAKQQQRRRQYQASLLRVRAAGEEYTPLMPRPASVGTFRLPRWVPYINVYGEDEHGELLLAVFPFDMTASSRQGNKYELWADEASRRVTCVITSPQDEAEMVTVRITCEPAPRRARIMRTLRRMPLPWQTTMARVQPRRDPEPHEAPRPSRPVWWTPALAGSLLVTFGLGWLISDYTLRPYLAVHQRQAAEAMRLAEEAQQQLEEIQTQHTDQEQQLQRAFERAREQLHTRERQLQRALKTALQLLHSSRSEGPEPPSQLSSPLSQPLQERLTALQRLMDKLSAEWEEPSEKAGMVEWTQATRPSIQYAGTFFETYNNSFDQGDLDALADSFTDDAELIFPDFVLYGKDQIWTHYENLHKQLAKSKYKAERWFTERRGDTVAFQGSWEAVTQATGKRMVLPIVMVLEFDSAGKVVMLLAIYDRETLQQYIHL